MPSVDAQQLRALVGAVHRPDSPTSAIAVRASAEWAGPDTLEGSPSVRVLACASPLAVRAALVDHAHHGDDAVLTILTPCTDGDLGPDLLARLAKGRVLSLDPFAAVLGLFRATVLDPALTRDDRWLVDELIELAPPGGWPDQRLIGGVLDNDTAWRVWHENRLGLADAPETLTGIMRIAEQPGLAGRLAALTDEQRTRLGARWAGGTPVARILVELIAGGHGASAVALGLVVDTLWAITDDPVLAQLQTIGRVRLEAVIGRHALDARAAAEWAMAAAHELTTPDLAQTHLDRAERLLANDGLEPLAVFSDHLDSGFERRIELLADLIDQRDASGATELFESLRRHRRGRRGAHRIADAEAAVRLLRRSASTSTTTAPTTLAQHIDAYAADGAWADEARRAITPGDSSTALAAAYRSLLTEADTTQRARDLAFAAALTEWSTREPIADDSFVPVEHVLDTIVRPIASEQPVLVLVCDGMGLAVAHELLRDLADEGWTPATPADRERWPVGVAMLPTVTEVSRTSLLTGARREGGQAEERNGFSDHPGLRSASAGLRVPVLFHKAQLGGPNGQAISDEVQQAVTDVTQRVVGVVVNAVDDHLSRGDQVRVPWGIHTLGPLHALLEAANEANRIIVLTADHGHVLHAGDAQLRSTGDGSGGERWRTPAPPAEADEVAISGPRVLKGGQVVLAVDERIHYAGHKHGYHGGASLQEVLVPVVALARQLPAGWVRRPLVPPSWWTGEIAAAPVAPPAPSTATTRTKSGAPKVGDHPTLFNEPTTIAQRTWVDQLLASPMYTAHSARVRLPRPLAAERIRGYLRAIHGNGGTIEIAALANRVGEPVDQLRMALTQVQRLLNIDGSEILAMRNNSTIELNAELLALQFEVLVP